MTRYKEFLRSEGHALLAGDYDVLPYYELVDVKTSVAYSGVVVTWYYSDKEPVAIIVRGDGSGVRFKPSAYDSADLMLPFDTGYMFWLFHNGYESEEARNVAIQMYRYSEKVRIAFRHRQAGIMDKEVFDKWFAARFRESAANKLYC